MEVVSATPTDSSIDRAVDAVILAPCGRSHVTSWTSSSYDHSATSAVALPLLYCCFTVCRQSFTVAESFLLWACWMPI